MENIKSISVFFPAWNEWGTLGSLIALTNRIIEKNKIKDNEIIVIDNGSTDNTQILLEELKNKYKNLKIVRLYPNQGYGGALKKGFETASKEFVFFADADIQCDMNRLNDAIKLVKEGVEVVAGYRVNRDDPFHRIIIGRLYRALVRRMFKLKTKDPDCDFRLIKNDIMKKIILEQKDGLICVELMKKIENRTNKIEEIPVKHFPRVFGKTKFFEFFQVYKTLKNLFKLRKKLIKEKEL